MKNRKKLKAYQPLLAIDPTVRGFGYVIFEGPKNPVDWAVADVRICKNKRVLARVKKLIEMYQPEIIVIEQANKSLRCNRVKSLLADIRKLAQTLEISIFEYSRNQILEVFGNFGKQNKHEVSTLISQWLPELAPRLPHKRKGYEAESEQYGLFDAAALGIAHMYLTD